jgi:hypothetical protein
MTLNGTDLAPFLTRHTSAAPVAAAAIQRAMEKKLRSAVFKVPGRNALISSSARTCSLSW